MENKKTVKKKTVHKRTTAKKTAAKKTAAKKTAAKKTAAKKTAAKKTAAKKTAAKKTSAKKTAAKKTAAKKTVVVKRTATKGATSLKRLKSRPRSVAKKKSPAPDADKIPHGYNEDTIVIMPVNADTNFIYWEITERLLKRKRKTPHRRSEKLVIRVFEEDSRREAYSFNISERIGKHYMKFNGPQKPLVAEIGVIRGRTFTSILRSDPTTVSPSSANTAGDEIWMQRIRDTYEIIRPPKISAHAEARLQWLLAKYYFEVEASRIGSLFGSMFWSLP
jgi:hypothetical protein